jgi:cytochrome P450
MMLQERIKQIEDIRRSDPSEASQHTQTIFHTLLQSDLPPAEKATGRLAEEAVLLVGAGTHTTSWCLTVIAFHLLSNPVLLRRLKEELGPVYQSSNGKPSLQDLEKLPFLTGVVKEGLRLGYGGVARSARIAPDVSLQCGDWTIPPGTPVSMTIPLTHHDESIFPKSDTFMPDRWMQNDSHQLDKYLVSFSKGSRVCVGMNLAWAELYVCTAGLFSQFGSREVQDAGDVGTFKLHETDESDVAMASDMFFPAPKADSKGVRIEVTSN